MHMIALAPLGGYSMQAQVPAIICHWRYVVVAVA